MDNQWSPKCQEYTECTHKSYRIKDGLRRTGTICQKCRLTISVLTEEIVLNTDR